MSFIPEQQIKDSPGPMNERSGAKLLAAGGEANPAGQLSQSTPDVSADRPVCGLAGTGLLGEIPFSSCR